jgi:hypothetical protein
MTDCTPHSHRAVRPADFPREEVWAMHSEIQAAFAPYEAIHHAEVTSILQALHQQHSDRMTLLKAGASMEGRTIWAARLGTGPVRILVWARQHGDEPICCAAAINALNYLLKRPDDPAARTILDGATILLLPLMNPDGAQRFTRRNAQGIDVNRDARLAMTLEGGTLRRLKDEFSPSIAFNLHDMKPRKSTSSEHELVALAVQAGPFDEWGGDNEVRRQGKRLCACMAQAAGAYAHGHITRYDAPFMPRAFGDSMMRWGVACCLIESGGWYGPGAQAFVERLHWLALLAGLHAAATGSEASANAAYYDALPLDTGPCFFDILIHRAKLLDGSARPVIEGDIGIYQERYGRRASDDKTRPLGQIEDFGDLGEDRGKTELDGRNRLVIPGLVAVAPSLRLSTPDDTSAVLPFLAAGCTTVVGGCGPFEDEEAFGRWRKSMGEVGLPVHFVAFEVVDSLATITARHAQTEAYGLLVPDLLVMPADLLAALHLFHPAAHSALTEEQQQLPLAVDLLLRMEGNPRRNRLHLLVRPFNGASPGPTADLPSAAALKQFFAVFLRHPDQIGVTVDTRCSALGFFPTPPYISGVGGGRIPPADFLAKTINTLRCGTEDGLSMVVSRMTRQPAVALGLMEIGLVRMEHRADLALFDIGDWKPGEGPALPARIAEPDCVIVNGEVAFADRQPTGQCGGLLLLR